MQDAIIYPCGAQNPACSTVFCILPRGHEGAHTDATRLGNGEYWTNHPVPPADSITATQLKSQIIPKTMPSPAPLPSTALTESDLAAAAREQLAATPDTPSPFGTVPKKSESVAEQLSRLIADLADGIHQASELHALVDGTGAESLNLQPTRSISEKITCAFALSRIIQVKIAAIRKAHE